MFPSLRFWRNCTTFLFVSVKFPSKETLVTASVNAWHPCGNTRKRSGNKSISCFRQHNRIETIAETRVYESETGVFELFPSWKKGSSPSWGGFPAIYSSNGVSFLRQWLIPSFLSTHFIIMPSINSNFFRNSWNVTSSQYFILSRLLLLSLLFSKINPGVSLLNYFVFIRKRLS